MTNIEAAWECVAGSVGGTVGGLATAGSSVFAATAVGIHTSADGAQTWRPAGLRNTVPFAEVVAPSARFAQDRTLFACAADGLYRSSDGGESWQPVLVGSRMLSVASSHAAGPEAIVLAASETDGVLRSENNGRSWQGANAGLLDMTVLSLALSPEFAVDRTGFAGTASGLYRTRNGARSWRAIETDVPEPAVQCLAVSPNFVADHLVLAGTEADGLLRSDDAGATWHRPPSLVDQGITALAFSTRYPTIAAAVESGIAISKDRGLTWRMAGSKPPGVVLSLIFVAVEDGEVLLAGLHRQGIARSSDVGATWEVANAGLSARLLTGLLLSPGFDQDQTMFAAGPQDGVSVSRDGGRTWVECTTGLEDPAVLELAISPTYPDDHTLYAATAAGVHISRDGGATWAMSPGTSAPARAIAAGPDLIVLAALPGGVLLTSDDGVRTWRTQAAAFDGGEIIVLAVSPEYARDRTIFVATLSSSAEVVLWRSVDGGARWVRWLVEREEVPAGGVQRFMALAVSPNYANDELVFAALGPRVRKPVRHAREVRAGQRRPVWRGADLGAGAVAVTALALSPSFADDHTLFAATNAGVFVSRDAGDTYAPWSEGLDPPAVVTLALSPTFSTDRLIYALGLGGTLWRKHDK